MAEIWKDVVDYEGIYEVSNKGRIRTNENKTTYTEHHGVRKWKQRILKQKLSNGSYRVSLFKHGMARSWLVHRLVAFAFLPLIENKNFVNHIDGSRLNNVVENLEWCNHTENNNHAFDNKLIKTAFAVTLIDKSSKKEYHFRSLAKANKFLNQYPGALSYHLKQGKTEVNGYKIILL